MTAPSLFGNRTPFGRASPGGRTSAGPGPAQIDLALKLRAACTLKIERVQAIVDGAILAVEQVQDQRIELLEKGPEVSISDVVFDALLGLALAGVGKALVPIAQSIANELAGVAAYYGKSSANPRFAKLLGTVLRKDMASKFEELGPSPRMDFKQIAKYNEAVRELTSEKIFEGLKQGAEKIEGSLEKKSPVHEVELESTDTVNVALLGAAQTYLSQQRYALTLFHSGLELFVIHGSPTEEDLKAIQELTAVDNAGPTLVEIRDRHKLLYEAVTWIKLFDLGKRIKAKGSGAVDLGVPPPLQRYFRARFARVILTWMKGVARDSYSADSVKSGQGLDLGQFGETTGAVGSGKDKFNPVSTDEFLKLNSATQDSAVNRFFAALSKDFDQVRTEQGTLKQGDGFSVSAEPVAKK